MGELGGSESAGCDCGEFVRFDERGEGGGERVARQVRLPR